PDLLAELSQVPRGDDAGAAPPYPRMRGGGNREPAFLLQSVHWGPAGAGPGVPLFDSLDLSGARGEVIALVGRSGSGQSRLLRLIGGFEVATAGVVWRATSNRRGGDSNGVAMAFEYPERQLVGRTVLEDVAMALWVRGSKRPERERMAVRALAAVGM